VPPPQALLGVLLGLRAEGETRIDDAERLDACYPGVVSTLQTLGASIARREAP
jgi:UDP-N-acetylglucosamine enolpyruvyl transferase